MNSNGKAPINTVGGTNYIMAGELITNNSLSSVMIETPEDLEYLADIYPPCTIAYTAGFAYMWQLDTSGQWVPIGEVSDASELNPPISSGDLVINQPEDTP